MKLIKCGEVTRPVLSPISRKILSMILAVEVLPFVPVRWMTG